MSALLKIEIEKLKKQILFLSTLVEENLRRAISIQEQRDETLTKIVIEQDSVIDKKEVEIEEECMKILALHQPVAIDLRYIIAILKINNDLERVGDLAVNISKRERKLIRIGYNQMDINLQSMMGNVMGMLKKSLDAFINMDPSMARDVLNQDDDIDKQNKTAQIGIRDKIVKDAKNTEAYLLLINISRHLERIADHATNIAEDVIYMIDGEIIRHQGGDE